MNLGSLLPNLKSTLIRVNTSQGPDMCHLLQGRISPLQPDTGLLSPLGLMLHSESPCTRPVSWYPPVESFDRSSQFTAGVFMCGCKQTQMTKRKKLKKSQYFAIHHTKDIYFIGYSFSEVIYQNPEYRNSSFSRFFITKAHVFCIFVVTRGEGQSLESFW